MNSQTQENLFSSGTSVRQGICGISTLQEQQNDGESFYLIEKVPETPVDIHMWENYLSEPPTEDGGEKKEEDDDEEEEVEEEEKEEQEQEQEQEVEQKQEEEEQ